MKVLRSFKFRIAAFYLAVTLVLLAVLGGVTYIMLSRSLYSNLDTSLTARYQEVRSDILLGGGRAVVVQQLGELILIYDNTGALVQHIGPDVNLAGVDDIVSQANAGTTGFFENAIAGGERLRLYAAKLDFGGHFVVIVARPTSDIAATLRLFRRTLAGTGILLLLLAGVGGWFLADRSLRPVELMTRAAREINEADLSRRIPVSGDDELGHLAATLNTMFARLELGFKRQKQFTADASHELRTPLAVIEAETSLALSRERSTEEYQRSLELVNQETAYMSRLIGRLLYLSRREAGLVPSQPETVNLTELFKDVFTSFEMLGRDKGLNFELGPLEPVTLTADATELKQVFVNVLENAVRYTPSGLIKASVQVVDGQVRITIQDTGIGIPAASLPHIFERFYRVDPSRSRAEGGSGLGLAMASEIVQSMGGSIGVDSQEGQGSTFTIKLPLSSTGSPASTT